MDGLVFHKKDVPSSNAVLVSLQLELMESDTYVNNLFLGVIRHRFSCSFDIYVKHVPLYMLSTVLSDILCIATQNFSPSARPILRVSLYNVLHMVKSDIIEPTQLLYISSDTLRK